MDYDNIQKLIDYLHDELDENKGIIEVDNGKKGKKFVYSTIKYSLSMEILLKKGLLVQEGAFAIYYTMSQDYVDSSLKGWTCNPYDKEYTK